MAVTDPTPTESVEQTEWTTEELREQFTVLGFSMNLCVVVRKSDGQKGSLDFDHHPRRYHSWVPHEDD